MHTSSRRPLWIFLSFVPFFSGLIGGGVGIVAYKIWSEQPNQRIRHFYEGEMAAVVSPTTVKRMIDQKDERLLLVDLRSKAEYDREHIIGALNIPASSMSSEQVVAAFRKLPKDKEIIVYCYSFACTLGRQVGRQLARSGIYVKEMSVGWTEWRYTWDAWNGGAAPLDGRPYLATGSADLQAPIIPCTEGEFGC